MNQLNILILCEISRVLVYSVFLSACDIGFVEDFAVLLQLQDPSKIQFFFPFCSIVYEHLRCGLHSHDSDL